MILSFYKNDQAYWGKGKGGDVDEAKASYSFHFDALCMGFPAALAPKVSPSSKASASFQNGACLLCIPSVGLNLSVTPSSFLHSFLPLLSMSLLLVMSQTENPGIQGVSFPVLSCWNSLFHSSSLSLVESFYLTALYVVLSSHPILVQSPRLLAVIESSPFLFKQPNSIFLSTSSTKYSPWAKSVNRL